MGHIRDLPKSTLGVDLEHGFRPEYMVIRGKEKQIRELRDAAQGRRRAARGRPGPGGGGDRLAPRRGAEAPRPGPDRGARDHSERRRGGTQGPPQGGSQPRLRAGGAPGDRPPGRLPAEPPALAEGAHRAVGGPGPVGRRAPGRRSRERDRRVRADRVPGLSTPSSRRGRAASPLATRAAGMPSHQPPPPSGDGPPSGARPPRGRTATRPRGSSWPPRRMPER